jgi:hypothetical protein
MPPIVKIQRSRGDGDCALVALAMYLERQYEDVFAAAIHVTGKSDIHNTGLYVRDIRRVAAHLGVPLSSRRTFDLDADEGIVHFKLAEKSTQVDEHVALVVAGLVFDNDATAWDPGLFCLHYGYKPMSLLVKASGE